MKNLFCFLFLICLFGCTAHDRKYPLFDSAYLNGNKDTSIYLGEQILGNTIIDGANELFLTNWNNFPDDTTIRYQDGKDIVLVRITKHKIRTHQ